MKKLIRRLIVAVVLATPLSCIAGEIALVNAFNISMSRYGQTWNEESYLVVVDNLAFDKEVYIHREKTDGSWRDIPMYYAGPAGAGKEYWKVSFSQSHTGVSFAVKMVANGMEYWDNNSGEDYQMNDAGYLLGKDRKVAVTTYSLNDSFPAGESKRFFASVVVDNLAPRKNIKLIYTTDGWYSSNTVVASYLGSRVIYGYGSYSNPNANRAEAWTVSFDIPADARGEFYVSYEVDGETYYDNNFGHNYKLNPVANYPSMYLRLGKFWHTGQSLKLIDDHLWAGTFRANEDGALEFKLDVYNDWSVNFGDNENDGIAERYGMNITLDINTSRDYHLIFNDETQVYSLQAFGPN